eukprot:TRINITY_DN3058_c0_g1_i1.p1 TRINITY_DN3058_c0_g1~~TRINITY_DN3058_c0_g1_i1.p1  ORF type:complete len:1340 (-),score=189.11 TRINITY_DN3058_c0_g1_i1:78-4097(-)
MIARCLCLILFFSLRVSCQISFGGAELPLDLVASAHASPSSKFRTSIVGGLDVKDGQFPFSVLLYNNNQPYCAGAILNERWVITSANCLRNDPTTLKILAGSASRSPVSATAQWVSVDWQIAYPHFRAGVTVGAIALIHTAAPFVWSSFIQPIEIVDYAVNFPGVITILGWGSTNAGAPWITLVNASGPGLGSLNPAYTANIPTRAQWWNFYLVSEDEANKRYARYYGVSWALYRFVGGPQLYAGTDTRGTCGDADDGAPVVMQHRITGKHVLVGINIWRVSCAGTIDIHAAAYYYRSWIQGAQAQTATVRPYNLEVALFPAYPGTHAATAQFRIRFPASEIGTDVWVFLPPGFTANDGNYTKVTQIQGIGAPSFVTVHPTNVLQLRWPAAQSVDESSVTWFTATNIGISGMCAPQSWVVQTWACNAPTPTLTPIPTFSPTATPTSTNTPLRTSTDTRSNTPTAFVRSTRTPTATPTFTPTHTKIRTSTLTPTTTDTNTDTRSSTRTRSSTSTATATRARTGTPTLTPSDTQAKNTTTTTSTPTLTRMATIVPVVNIPTGPRGCQQVNPETSISVVYNPPSSCRSRRSVALFTTISGAWVAQSWIPGRAGSTNTSDFRFASAAAAFFNNNTIPKSTVLGAADVHVVSAQAVASQSVVEWYFAPVKALAIALEDIIAVLRGQDSAFQFYLRQAEVPTQGYKGASVVTAIAPENQAPSIVIAVFAINVTEDVAMPIPAPFVIVDDALATEVLEVGIVVPSSPPQGNLRIAHTAGLTFRTGFENGKAVTNFTGTKAALNAALSSTTFEPFANYNGDTYIEVTVNDLRMPAGSVTRQATGGLTASVRVSVHIDAVNDPPSLEVTNPGGLKEGGSTRLNFKIHDPDADRFDQMQVTISTVPSTCGTFVINGPTSGLSFTTNTATAVAFTGTWSAINNAIYDITFTPANHFFGSAVMRWVVNDLGHNPAPPAILTQDVAIDVAPINDAPTISAPATFTVNEDERKQFSPTISISDIDALRAGNISVNVSVSFGVLTFTPPALSGVFVYQPFPQTPRMYQLIGFKDDINTALAAMWYQSDKDWNGADKLLITVNDMGQTGPGLGLTAAAEVTITVAAVNDAPVITAPLAVATSHWYNVTIPVSVSDVDSGSTYVDVTLEVGHGHLTIPQFSNPSLASVITPAGQLVNVQNSMLIRGRIDIISASLAKLIYMDTSPDPTPVSNIVSDYHSLDFLSITVNDNGATGSGGALQAFARVNISLTAEVYPTCNEFLQRNPGFCGCYFKVPHAQTDSGEWVALPLSFPSVQFQAITEPRRYMQGCCQSLPPAYRNTNLQTVGHLDVCSQVSS